MNAREGTAIEKEAACLSSEAREEEGHEDMSAMALSNEDKVKSPWVNFRFGHF